MTDEQWFETLGWALLEFQCVYFTPGRVHQTWLNVLTITDAQYTMLENEYLELSMKLDLEPTATNGVGFVPSRPAEHLVAAKLFAEKGKRRGVIESGDLGPRGLKKMKRPET